MAVEAKAQIKKNYREGREVSAELIGADRAIHESDSNETIEEAPSIVDELGTKDSGRRAAAAPPPLSVAPLAAKTGSKHGSRGSSNMSRKSSIDSLKAAGEQVSMLKEVEARLKEEVSLGQEVGKELIVSQEEHVLEIMRRRPLKIQKISHFQAMALMGKALFGALKQDPVKAVESLPISTPSSSDSREYSDNFEESEEDENRTSSNHAAPRESYSGRRPAGRVGRGPTREEAATKIQAGYRGHKARRDVAKLKREREHPARLEVHIEEVDIDLEDPEVKKSASMIQSRFRGGRARKSEVAQVKEEKVVEKPAEEEEIDIDLTDPNVEKSATKIQATFRGSKARKEVAKIKEEVHKGADKDANHSADQDVYQDADRSATVLQAGYRGHMARKKVAKMQEDSVQGGTVEHNVEEIDIDLNDPNVEKSATKIQATFRGSKARKEVAKVKEEKKLEVLEENSNNNVKCMYPEEEIDIDMTDPNVEKSATKIQATFRGSKARKEVAKIKEEKVIVVDEEVEKSATIIQSGYRGHLARKKVSQAREENAEEPENAQGGPDVDKSATVIQANYRGHRARKEMATMREKARGPDVDRSATVIQANYRGHRARKEVANLKEERSNKETINWQDPELNTIATSIQAGYKGMKVREEMKVKEEADAACKIQANFRGFQARKCVNRLRRDKEVEDRLGIDLEDPEVRLAATKIQAGFRGMQTRRKLREEKNPHIVVEDTSEYTELESETSYYEDEEEEEDEEALEERPPTPETSVERFSQEKKETLSGGSSGSESKVRGFRAMAMVAKLMQNRKSKFEEIRRGSVADFAESMPDTMKGNQAAGETTENPPPTAAVKDENEGGQSVTVQVATAPGSIRPENEYGQNDEDFEPDDEQKSDDDEDDDEEDNEDEEEEEEEEEEEPVEVKEEKKPFFLLKRLVGIMSLTGGSPRPLAKPNKVGILPQVKEPELAARGPEVAGRRLEEADTVKKAEANVEITDI